MSGESGKIPDQVADFIETFYKHFSENSVSELFECYETEFNKLSEKYYTKTPWPEPMTEVASLVNDDQAFLVLYSEVYYRHIYAKIGPTLAQRAASYNNYCNLFNMILNNEGGPVTFELPNEWLWDIIDEFIYQFNDFSIYRSKLINSNGKNDKYYEEELAYLKEHTEIWSSYSVLNALYSVIGRSNIYEQLSAQKNNLPAFKVAEIAGSYGSLPLYKNLGYFSIIGLLRIHTILGDFTLALKTMEEIEVSKKFFLKRVPGAHFTANYYTGFCYLMMHRYSDAIKTFSYILTHIARTKSNAKVGQFDAVTKKSEQMYALLAILLHLCPTRIDESLVEQIKERFGEQISKLSKNGEISLKVIEELFLFGAPKFISISLPNFDIPELNIDAVHLHLNVFMVTVRSSIYNNLLKTYLNLYSKMELTKLAKFLQSDEDVKIKDLDELKEILISFKLTNNQIKWTNSKSQNEAELNEETGGLLNGEVTTIYDFDITLNDNLIEIIEMKVARKFSHWFISNSVLNVMVQESIVNDKVDDIKYNGRDKNRKKGKK